ncbi:MAG: transposase [Planctomycetota bacterium]
MEKKPVSKPFAYFVTFSIYGTWLHGADKGSVDKYHNQYNSEFLSANAGRKRYEIKNLKDVPFVLNKNHRRCALKSIKETCEYRGWVLHAVHVRSNHVHIVVSSETIPEKVLGDLKAYATRGLRSVFSQFVGRKIWTHHGSTKYIWTQKSLMEVIHYVIYEQGQSMEWWCRYDIQNPEQSPERK